MGGAGGGRGRGGRGRGAGRGGRAGPGRGSTPAGAQRQPRGPQETSAKRQNNRGREGVLKHLTDRNPQCKAGGIRFPLLVPLLQQALCFSGLFSPLVVSHNHSGDLMQFNNRPVKSAAPGALIGRVLDEMGDRVLGVGGELGVSSLGSKRKEGKSYGRRLTGMGRRGLMRGVGAAVECVRSARGVCLEGGPRESGVSRV